MNGFHVDTADLKGWSAEVGRQSGYVTDVATYGSTNLSDTDFGKILELLTGAYRLLVPEFLTLIRQAGSNLGREGTALNAALTGYSHEEAKTRAHLDKLVKVPGAPLPHMGGPEQAR